MNCGPKGCPTPETCRAKGMCCSGGGGYTKPNMNSGKKMPAITKRNVKMVIPVK